MSANKFADEFKRDAVAQVEDRGYPVREVAERLGVSTKSIYTWPTQFMRPAKVIQAGDDGGIAAARVTGSLGGHRADHVASFPRSPPRGTQSTAKHPFSGRCSCRPCSSRGDRSLG